jgi:hypothetical protein
MSDGIYLAPMLFFTGECLCVSNGGASLLGILRGYGVSATLSGSQFDVGGDTLQVSGTQLKSMKSGDFYNQALRADTSMCLDLKYTGLYAEGVNKDDPADEIGGLLVANGYVAEARRVDGLHFATLVSESSGKLVVEHTEETTLVWDDPADPGKVKFSTSASPDAPVFSYTKVGSLGERVWSNVWDLQVYATADNDFGIVFSYADGYILAAQIPSKAPLDSTAWDLTSVNNFSYIILETALSTNDQKDALFIGQYEASDKKYTVDPATAQIKAKADGSPPDDWREQAYVQLASEGRAEITTPIVDTSALLVGYEYKKEKDNTPRTAVCVKTKTGLVLRAGSRSYTLTYKGQIDKLPPPPTPWSPTPGPSGGGGGGGGGDNTGLMVALLLGLLAYALMK